MHELGKLDKKVRKTVIDMMKRVTIQHHEIKRLEKLLKKKDEELKSLNQVQKNNEDLKTQVDELTNKLMYEQTRGMEVKCSNERIMDSLAILEIAHEVMVTVVKSNKQIDNTCSQNENKEKQYLCEQVIVEDCNDDLALENEVLKQEVERLSQDLSKLKGKSVVQPSQDNRDTMVKKLEKGSTVQNSCKLIHKSKESKSQARKKNMDHIKCYKCSNMGHYASMCSIKIEGQQTLSKRQRSLAKRRCFGCCKMGHRIATCPDKSSKPGSSGLSSP